AFLLYGWYFFAIFFRPRPDGQAGCAGPLKAGTEHGSSRTLSLSIDGPATSLITSSLPTNRARRLKVFILNIDGLLSAGQLFYLNLVCQCLHDCTLLAFLPELLELTDQILTI